MTRVRAVLVVVSFAILANLYLLANSDDPLQVIASTLVVLALLLLLVRVET